jgi:hypothetical protein
MTDECRSNYQAAYQHFFDACPGFELRPPWDFLVPDTQCRSTPPQATDVASQLRARFDDGTLIAAELLQRSRTGELALNRALRNPSGAIITYRATDAVRPFAMLTARGLQTGQPGSIASTLPVLAALHDHQTRTHLPSTGALFAAWHMQDVVILRSLGLPCTLARGLSAVSLEGLSMLDAAFGEDEPFDVGPEPDEADEAQALTTNPDPANAPLSSGEQTPERASAVPTDAGARPLLILMGWSLARAAPVPAAVIARTATHLARARRFLGLTLSGLWLWRPSRTDLGNLDFRLACRAPALLAEALHPELLRLEDLEVVVNAQEWSASAPTPTVDFAQAQANLMAVLAPGPTGPCRFEQVRAALSAYEAAVERDLSQPLLAWAAKHSNPLIRAAGGQLVHACALLHRMAPRIYELQALHWLDPRAVAPELSDALRNFLQLNKQLGEIYRAIKEMESQPW